MTLNVQTIYDDNVKLIKKAPNLVLSFDVDNAGYDRQLMRGRFLHRHKSRVQRQHKLLRVLASSVASRGD